MHSHKPHATSQPFHERSVSVIQPYMFCRGHMQQHPHGATSSACKPSSGRLNQRNSVTGEDNSAVSSLQCKRLADAAGPAHVLSLPMAGSGSSCVGTGVKAHRTRARTGACTGVQAPTCWSVSAWLGARKSVSVSSVYNDVGNHA